MSTTPNPSEPFLSLDALAAKSGLPLKWLRDEANAGRIPFLRVGRRRMFLASEVRQALAERGRTDSVAGLGVQP